MYFIIGDVHKIDLLFYCSDINVTLVWEVINAGIPVSENKILTTGQQPT